MRDKPSGKTPLALRGSTSKRISSKRRREERSPRHPRSTRPANSQRIEGRTEAARNSSAREEGLRHPTSIRRTKSQRIEGCTVAIQNSSVREVVPHRPCSTRSTKSQVTEDCFSLQKEGENADDDKEDADDTAEMRARIKACFREENGRMKCIHCSKTLSCKSGPSTQKYHVNTSCKVLVHCTQKPAFTNSRANTLLCRMITEDYLSLRLTESPNLRAFVDYLRPGYQPPSRTTLTKTWLPKVKASLKKRMAEKLGTIEYFSLVRRMDKHCCA